MSGVPGRTADALRASFFYPPFSILDARAGWWQARKKLWLREGLRSDLGRKPTFQSNDSIWHIAQSRHNTSMHTRPPAWATTSIFDPVLAEIALRWFVPKGGRVFDPFAGGVVRGLVASRLGLSWTGWEIRQEQIDANRAQMTRLQRAGDPPPVWQNQDACTRIWHGRIRRPVDFVFTCPPYGDLEVCSSDPRDLSHMPWDIFAGALSHAVRQAAWLLADNRFMAFVVSDIRDRNGHYRGLPGVVRRAAREAGLAEHGELVLASALGTAPVRARIPFERTRKICRTHQLLLVFLKGCAVRARAAIGEVRCDDPFLNTAEP